jgi:hypothetical protein
VALNDAATLVIGSGNYLTAPVGTAMPTDLTAPDVAWESIGHTSLEDIFGATSEGGDATVLGTLQNKSLRTSYSPRQETFAVKLQQFDKPGLKLYYGSNAVELADGSLGVPQDPEPTEVAFLAIFIDGENVFAFYAPKAEVFRGDDIDLSSAEALASLPLSVKPLVYQTNTWAYAVTPLAATP